MAEQLYRRTAEIDRRIGACVRAARIEAGLSQSRLAAELGITFQQLQKYEKGRNRIAVGTLLLIAAALSVPVHRFFEALDDADAASPLQPGGDGGRLLAAFDRIGDPEVRRRILTLVLAVSETPDRPIVLVDAPATAATPAS